MLWIEGFKETAAELVRLFSFFWACAGCSDQGASKERGRRTDHLVPSALEAREAHVSAVSAFVPSARRARGRLSLG